MKAVFFGFGVLLLAFSAGVAQEQPPPPQDPTLTYQVQPSEMDKAKMAALVPRREPQITFTSPLLDLARGESLFQRPNRTNVVLATQEDMTVDLITRRPRGIVLLAIKF